MTSDEASRHIRHALRAELDKRWGQRLAINQVIGHGLEYLSKVCRGILPIKLDELLSVLEFMGTDAGRFFADALGTSVANDWLLEDLGRFGEIHQHLRDLERATVRLELAESPGPAPPLADVDKKLADVIACSLREQRRRLTTARKYRHPALVAAYLEHLDALRYDDPRVARDSARVIAVKVIPRLPGSQRERIELQLKAIGIFASGHRQKASFATAARALRFALAFARRHQLPEATADLLQRGAYVLSDNDRYVDAMKLLDEALVIYIDLDSAEGLGAIMVDRGAVLIYLGEYQKAVVALQKSLDLLRLDSLRADRNRLAAHQALSYAYEEMGDLDSAECAIARAAFLSEQTGRINRATVFWRYGAIAFAREEFGIAEERLQRAYNLFESSNEPNKAMLALDLTKVLAAQGNRLGAVAMATSMRQFLAAFRGNKVAEAAINDLIRTALSGDLTVAAIERAEAKIVSAGLKSRAPGV